MSLKNVGINYHNLMKFKYNKYHIKDTKDYINNLHIPYDFKETINDQYTKLFYIFYDYDIFTTIEFNFKNDLITDFVIFSNPYVFDVNDNNEYIYNFQEYEDIAESELPDFIYDIVTYHSYIEKFTYTSYNTRYVTYKNKITEDILY